MNLSTESSGTPFVTTQRHIFIWIHWTDSKFAIVVQMEQFDAPGFQPPIWGDRPYLRNEEDEQFTSDMEIKCRFAKLVPIYGR